MEYVVGVDIPRYMEDLILFGPIAMWHCLWTGVFGTVVKSVTEGQSPTGVFGTKRLRTIKDAIRRSVGS